MNGSPLLMKDLNEAIKRLPDNISTMARRHEMAMMGDTVAPYKRYDPVDYYHPIPCQRISFDIRPLQIEGGKRLVAFYYKDLLVKVLTQPYE